MLSNFGQSIIDFLKQLITWAPGLIIGVVFHEYAHGFIAYKSGDPTAKNMGRLTLNPMTHIDIFGSILLPIVDKLKDDLSINFGNVYNLNYMVNFS